MLRPTSPDRVKVRCLECLAPIWLGLNIRLGMPVTCPECHTPQEISRLKPPTLDYMDISDDYELGDDEIAEELL